jgi:hypothetical protein
VKRHNRFPVATWRDPTFRALSVSKPNARTLYLYLLTGPHLEGVPGLFVLNDAAVAQYLGWPVDTVRPQLTEVYEAGLASVDWRRSVVWVPEAARANLPARPGTMARWQAFWPLLPPCPLVDEARETLRAWVSAKGAVFADVFAVAVGEIRTMSRANWDSVRRHIAPIVRERDGHRCKYCGSPKDLTVDHVVPLTRGGTCGLDNLVTACRPCNSSKNDKTPSEWKA